MLPRPSRLVLNLGILTGAAAGFLIQYSLGSDEIQSFIITAVCAMLGAGVFSYTEYFIRRSQNRQP